MGTQLRATVVLPTHGRRLSLLRVLRALALQDAPDGAFDVVVICDGDIDGSSQACTKIAAALPYVLQVITKHNSGPAAARNQGIAAAEGELIIFLDDDVIPDPGLVSAHLAAHEQSELAVSVGPLLPPEDWHLSAWGLWEERTLVRQYDAIMAGEWKPCYRQFYTGNAAVRKKHILAAHGFDVRFRRAEDIELALRLHDLGLHFVFLADARGWHYINRSFGAWRRAFALYGSAEVVMAEQGRPELLNAAAADFHNRHRAIRYIVTLCAGRRALTRSFAGTLSLGALVLNHMRARELVQPLCSLLSNLLYFDSFATAIGGHRQLLRLLNGDDEVASRFKPEVSSGPGAT